jgi:peptidoglycan/LPS O-acetylase OafA/YrhL
MKDNPNPSSSTAKKDASAFEYRLLNHWRGIAVLWVLAFHGFGTTYDKTIHPAGEFLKWVAAPGWLGVHLFFVISGYCIGANASRLFARGLGAHLFLADRLFRILPTYWAAFFVTLVVNVIASPFNGTGFHQNLPGRLRDWIGNLLLIQPYAGVNYYVVVYWSLVVELAFYALMAIYLLGYRRAPTSAIMLFGALTLVSCFVRSQSCLALMCWPEFVCGALAFVFSRERSKSTGSGALIAMSGIVILGAFGFIRYSPGSACQLGFSAAFALLLCALHPFDRKFASLASIRWLGIVGTFSYSIYLLHLPLGGRIIGIGRRYVSESSFLFVGLQVAYWLVALAAAYAFYMLVESRFEAWRHRLRTQHSAFADRRAQRGTGRLLASPRSEPVA